MKKKIISGLIGLASLVFTVTVVFAQPGTAVQPPIPVCVGIGVAYDGNDILYTCASDPTIYKTDLTGANNGSIPTVDAGGNSVSVDAIAWDSNENKLWGGDLDGAGSCRIWSIDMATGIATQRFTFTDPSPLARCSVAFFDGITVDSVTDTIYASPDVHTHIRHFKKDGTPAANDPIDFETLTIGQCPWAQGFGAAGCWNSGLAIGLDGNLFAGTANDGKIFQFNPTTPASLIGLFATVSGRDEDLECGPIINGKETILSKQLEGPIDVLEAPEGTCQSPVEPEPITGRMTGGGKIPAGKVTLEGKHGFELHCDPTQGPNRLEVNWGKGNKFHLETLDSAVCSDDPAIGPNPPAAGFDTYVGKGTGRLNGVSGATAKWEFRDAGEPGKNDYATIVINDGVNPPYTFTGYLQNGNHQAHK